MWHQIKQKLFARRYLRQQLNYTQQQLLLSQSQLLRVQKKQLLVNQVPTRVVNCLVSLTSYGERIKTLHYTLYSLLNQTVKPQKIIVWLAHGEELTVELQALDGVISFSYCDDLRSFKKLIPTLGLGVNVPVITFDDDVIYPQNQIQRLYTEHLAQPDVVVCHRAHKIILKANKIAPYQQWEFDVAAPAPSHLLLPIGIGGVLYPPNCFADEVSDVNLFTALCPTADDIWFKFMALKKGYKTKLVPNPLPYSHYLHVAGCQESSLWQYNKTANDTQLTALINYDQTLLQRLKD